jgi:DNA-binding transcriptional MocR family regulator
VTSWYPDLDKRSGPRYLALADAITDAITRGELAPGERLPTHRDLAYKLSVSVHTVSQAYGEVRRRGYIAGETGRGTFVQAPKPDNERQHLMDRRVAGVTDLSLVRPAQLPAQSDALREAFATLSQDPECAFMLACRPIAGLDNHRETGAAWLARMGVDVDPAATVVTNGIAHGMTAVLSALVEPGDMVATEALTDHGIIALSNVLHFRLQGLDTDEEGMRPDALDAACHRHPLKAVAVTPNLCNPTAQFMSEERRRQVAAVARKHDITIVEDDAYGALLPDRPPPIWRFAPERTCYLTSFTKPVVSGLRTGYLTAAEPLILRVVSRVRATSWMATPLPAEVATRWFADGTLDDLVTRQREEMTRRNALAAAELEGYRYWHHPSGLHLWLELPRPWRAANFVTQVRLHNVAVSSPEPFVVGRRAEPHAVRVCLGGPATLPELAKGLRRLRSVLEMGPEPAYLEV